MRRLPPAPPRPRVRLTEAVPGLIRHLPHHKPWMVALSVIAVVVVLATCGMGSYLLLRDDSKTVSADATSPPTARLRDIENRTTDGALMKASDVFPGVTIVPGPGITPYKRVGDIQVESNCRLGANGDVGTLLVSLGCNQMLRATFLSSDGLHYVTAGVFNLLDAASATKAHDQLPKMINATSRFTGYITTTPTQVIGRAPTNLAYLSQGHFLLYIVIVRKDGAESPPTDPQIKLIVFDVLEHYLRDVMLVKWQTELIGTSSATRTAG